MGEYAKQLELLIELLDKKKITINVNSERTAVANGHKMYECLDDLNKASQILLAARVFRPFGNGELMVDEWPAGYSYMEKKWGPLKDFVKTYLIIEGTDMLHKKVFYESHRVGKVPSAKLIKISNPNPHQGVGIGFLKETNDYRYYIEWVPVSETKTKKRVTQNDLALIQDEVRQIVGTLYTLPPACGIFKRVYNNVHTDEYISAVATCNAYISGERQVGLCSAKQAYWIAKLFKIPEAIAAKFNSCQARELLEYLFKPTKVSDDEAKKITDHYTQKAKEFGLKESKIIKTEKIHKTNMARKNTIRLTESDLKRVIAESVRRIISESIYDDNDGFSSSITSGSYNDEQPTDDGYVDYHEELERIPLQNKVNYLIMLCGGWSEFRDIYGTEYKESRANNDWSWVDDELDTYIYQKQATIEDIKNCK